MLHIMAKRSCVFWLEGRDRIDQQFFRCAWLAGYLWANRDVQGALLNLHFGPFLRPKIAKIVGVLHLPNNVVFDNEIRKFGPLAPKRGIGGNMYHEKCSL